MSGRPRHRHFTVEVVPRWPASSRPLPNGSCRAPSQPVDAAHSCVCYAEMPGLMTTLAEAAGIVSEQTRIKAFVRSASLSFTECFQIRSGLLQRSKAITYCRRISSCCIVASCVDLHIITCPHFTCTSDAVSKLGVNLFVLASISLSPCVPPAAPPRPVHYALSRTVAHACGGSAPGPSQVTGLRRCFPDH